MKKNIDDLDLNLLRMLRVVVATRNLSTAANQLGVSQTTVSRGLAKLRETFGEQLFIRKAHGVEPSELAERLASATDSLLDPIVETIEKYHNFTPTKYKGKLVIALELGLLEIFGSGISHAINKVMPNVDLELIYWKYDSLQKILDRKIDYMIHYSLYPTPQDIYIKQLTNIEICLIAKKNHPILSKSSHWEVIHNLPLVRFISEPENSEQHIFDKLYIERGYTPNYSLSSHSINVIVDKIINSNAILYGTSYQQRQSSELECYPLPYMPNHLKSFSISGGYLQSKRSLPINILLQKTISNFFKSIGQP